MDILLLLARCEGLSTNSIWQLISYKIGDDDLLKPKTNVTINKLNSLTLKYSWKWIKSLVAINDTKNSNKKNTLIKNRETKMKHYWIW